MSGQCIVMNRRRFLSKSAAFLFGSFAGLNSLSKAFALDNQASQSRIALIIDDIGFNRSRAMMFMELEVPITFSILPRLAKSASLADVEEYASLAKALYKLGAYVAIIGDESWGNGMWDLSGKENNLTEFLTFGTGYARDEKGLYIALVLVHDGVEKAEANVDSLPKRVGEFAPYADSEPGEAIYDTQIYNEENVLLAKLYTDEPQLWSWWLESGGGLLYHGE